MIVVYVAELGLSCEPPYVQARFTTVEARDDYVENFLRVEHADDLELYGYSIHTREDYIYDTLSEQKEHSVILDADRLMEHLAYNDEHADEIREMNERINASWNLLGTIIQDGESK